MRIIWGLLTLLAVCQMATAQSLKKTINGFATIANGIKTDVQFFSPAIVRILKSPDEKSFRKESISVIKKPGSTKFSITQKGTDAIAKTDSLQVVLDMRTGSVSFNKPNGEPLFSESGTAVFTAITDVNKPTYKVKQAWQLDTDEAIYGLGQQQNGKLSQRNQKMFLRQDNMKVAIPFFQSIKGYGVFWDNYSPTNFADSANITSFSSQVGDCIDYYFLMGSGGDGVVAQMRNLTGQAPLMPLWTYGFNQSKERYKTQFELVDVVKKYRELQVPLDGIVQDWQYWGKDSNWNAMSFDPATFPRPKAMVDSVHGLNAHLFIVAWPGVGPWTPLYKELKAKNMLLDFETWPPKSGSRPYDVYSPQARNIYWQHLDKGIFSLDTDAWWLDSSEPDHVNLKEKDFDLSTYLGTFRSVRNAFPIAHVGGVYDNQRKTTSAKRVSILTRSAFAGQQRYGANTWSGDIQSTWQTFKKQIPAALNFTLNGIPYWNADIGGFFAGRWAKDGGAKNPEFQELYTRWMQFATFTPLMRSHGTEIPREIYNFGTRGDSIFDAQERFINLRYSLLPYTYSTAWNVTKKGGSIMRALFMDFPADKQVHDLDGEYLYGKSILVAPVTDKGVTAKTVYLPAGSVWYDFWTGEKLNGSNSINKATPIDILPLYVKAGSIIPWGPKVQFAEEKKWDNLEIRIFPGADADFTLYEDENNNYNYEKGRYSEIFFHWNDISRILTIEKRKGNFPGMLSHRNFKLVVVDKNAGLGITQSQKISKTIYYSGQSKSIKL